MGKIKLLFDTNVTDKIEQDFNFFATIQKYCELYIADITFTKINQIKDDVKKLTILSNIKELDIRVLNNDAVGVSNTAIAINSKTGQKYKNYTIIATDNHCFDKLKDVGVNNKKDYLIAEIAYQNHCVLITEDKPFYKKVKNRGYKIMNLQEVSVFMNNSFYQSED